MRMMKQTALRVIGQLIVAVSTSLSTIPAVAFKPAYDSYGHRMITKELLGREYRFGVRVDGSTPFALPRYSYELATAPAVRQTIRPVAVAGIVAGVESRDEGLFTPYVLSSPTLCGKVGAFLPIVSEAGRYFGASNPWRVGEIGRAHV